VQPALVNPHQGPPWTPVVDDWPGVAGVAGETNYYALNRLGSQPDRP